MDALLAGGSCDAHDPVTMRSLLVHGTHLGDVDSGAP